MGYDVVHRPPKTLHFDTSVVWHMQTVTIPYASLTSEHVCPAVAIIAHVAADSQGRSGAWAGSAHLRRMSRENAGRAVIGFTN